MVERSFSAEQAIRSPPIIEPSKTPLEELEYLRREIEANEKDLNELQQLNQNPALSIAKQTLEAPTRLFGLQF